MQPATYPSHARANRVIVTKKLWTSILQQINQLTGTPTHDYTTQSIGGGCINETIKLTTGGSNYFVKLNNVNRLAMFEREAEGLRALAASQSIRVPKVICMGIVEKNAYLVIEYIEMSSHGNAEQAGQQLAWLHNTVSTQYGQMSANYIGSTPQINHSSDDWLHFWQQNRLGYQLRLAAKQGYGGELQTRGERLQEKLPALIGHSPKASLLHGDLWSGNFGYCANGKPVIFDPAVYYGDRETDLAMTELFGGFPRRFYEAYNEVWPLDTGYKTRKTLYNLYHIINHLNLFGGGYEKQALAMIDQLLAETG
jgi:protein-ribulosamine 3-kinase